MITNHLTVEVAAQRRRDLVAAADAYRRATAASPRVASVTTTEPFPSDYSRLSGGVR